MIGVGSIVTRPGGTQRWVVRSIGMEIGTHRRWVEVQPLGEAWTRTARKLAYEDVRPAPPDLEEFPLGTVH